MNERDISLDPDTVSVEHHISDRTKRTTVTYIILFGLLPLLHGADGLPFFLAHLGVFGQLALRLCLGLLFPSLGLLQALTREHWYCTGGGGGGGGWGGGGGRLLLGRRGGEGPTGPGPRVSLRLLGLAGLGALQVGGRLGEGALLTDVRRVAGRAH